MAGGEEKKLERTFTVETRTGEVYEIENAISDAQVEKTKKEVDSLKKRYKSCAILACTIAAGGIFYIACRLRKSFYITDTSGYENHIHMSSVLTTRQMGTFIFSFLLSAMVIAWLCYLYAKGKDKWKKRLHMYNEQLIYRHIVRRLQVVDAKEVEIEFGRTPFGDVMLTFIIGKESFMLSEHLRRMPVEACTAKRLRFMADTIYYLNSTKTGRTGKNPA